jgi:hypothetical protein
MFGFDLSFALGVAAGGALIWFGKDRILAVVIGAEALATRLEAKSRAIKAAL